jgi:hypothetical protein
LPKLPANPAKIIFLAIKNTLIRGIAVAKPFADGGKNMDSLTSSNTNAIIYNKTSLAAAKCRKCGVKMYPRSLLRPHLTRHQQKDLWLATELRKLRYRFGRMREIA